MNLFGKLQNQYDQLWKDIVRPTRATYSQQSLGPKVFKLQNRQVLRQDFNLTNNRGLTFGCSLWIPSDLDTFNCIIYLHGNTGNRIQGMEFLGKFIRHNTALCTFDFSGSGNAEGQFISLGYYEQQDLRIVIQYLRETFKIGNMALWGKSMGAVTALLYLHKTIDIKGVVLDSPYKSVKCLIEDITLKNSKMPSFVLKGALKIVASTIQQKAKFKLSNINPLKYSVPGLYLPAYFIASVDDEMIPSEHTRQLYVAYGSQNKEISFVKGKHNDFRPLDIIDDAFGFIEDKFNHDWKEQIKNSHKYNQFLEMEAMSEENRKKEDIDFFADESLPAQEVQKVEEKIKTGQFSLMGIFNIFSKGEKKKEKESKPVKDKYDQMRAVLSQKSKQFQNERIVSKINVKQSQKKMRAQSVGSEYSQNDLRQWIYCSL